MTLGPRIAPLLLAAVIAACQGSQGKVEGGRGGTVAARSIDQVLAAHTDSLMALPGVVGTAIGLCEGERCIKVLVADAKAATNIPTTLEGFRVVTEVTGTFRPR